MQRCGNNCLTAVSYVARASDLDWFSPSTKPSELSLARRPLGHLAVSLPLVVVVAPLLPRDGGTASNPESFASLFDKLN